MLGDMFLWLVANVKQGVIYFIKQACGNDILASVYSSGPNKHGLKLIYSHKKIPTAFTLSPNKI